MANKNKGGSLKKVISNGNLSLKELTQLSKGGNDPLKIMSQALKQGSTLGAKLVNAYNSPGGLNSAGMVWRYGGTPDNLNGLKGVTLGKGQAYSGSYASTTPYGNMPDGQRFGGVTTYNPIITNRNRGMTISGAQQSEDKGGRGGRNKGGSGSSMSGGGNDEWRGGYKNQTKEEILNEYAAESGQSTDTAATDNTATDTTSPDITINTGGGNMSGGGSAGAGATGFKTKRSRIRQLGIRAGSKILNRTNKFYDALN